MSWVRLRQIALVAETLEPVVDQLSAELGLRVAHRDPGVAAFGLHNVVMPLGRQFIEVVAPTQQGTAAGRQLERLGGDGGYMVIGHVGPSRADHQAFLQRVEDLGIRMAFSRVDDAGYHIAQLHPSDTGGSFLELDYQPGEDPDGPWMPAGPDWEQYMNTEIVQAIAGVELRVSDPEVVAQRWAAICNAPLEGLTLRLDNAHITFAPGEGGIVAIDCVGGREHNVTIGGVEFRIAPAR